MDPVAQATAFGIIVGAAMTQMTNSIINIMTVRHKNRMEDNTKVISELKELITKLQAEGTDKQARIDHLELQLEAEQNASSELDRKYNRAIDWIEDIRQSLAERNIQTREFDPNRKPRTGTHKPLEWGKT